MRRRDRRVQGFVLVYKLNNQSRIHATEQKSSSSITRPKGPTANVPRLLNTIRGPLYMPWQLRAINKNGWRILTYCHCTTVHKNIPDRSTAILCYWCQSEVSSCGIEFQFISPSASITGRTQCSCLRIWHGTMEIYCNNKGRLCRFIECKIYAWLIHAVNIGSRKMSVIYFVPKLNQA